MEQVTITRRELCAQLDRAAAETAARQTKYEQAAFYEKAALAVIEGYVRVRQLSPIVASNPDPDPVKRSEKLSFALIDWCVDVESATEAALLDRPDLQAAWFDIAVQRPMKAALQSEVLQKSGRVYAARKLAPWHYWRRGNQ